MKKKKEYDILQQYNLRRVKMSEKSNKNSLLEWVVVIAVAFVLSMVIKSFILSSTLVVGSSMNDTLKTRDRLFVNRISFMVDDVDYGDIVEFKSPVEDKDYIKRVIGLPGDTVEIKDDKVLLNGKELKESYTNSDRTLAITDQTKWEVEEGKVFVLGDNRLPNGSKDSRDFGTIDKDSIVGIAFFRFYPFNQIGTL